MGGSSRFNNQPLSVRDVSEALNYVDNSDRETWVQMAMAVKAGLGEAGFEAWLTWSKGHESFKQRDAEAVWRGIHSSGGVTIASLFFHAKRAGYRRPTDTTQATSNLYRPGEYQALIRHRQAQRKQQDRARSDRIMTRQARAARRYAAFYAKLPPALDHPYLRKKNIAGYGIRHFKSHKRNVLVIPMLFHSGKFLSCQIIGNQERRFVKGASAKGGFFKIRGIAERLIACEGFATGATLHAATGYSVAVTFSDHNLPIVAESLAYHQPEAQLIIAGDDDCQNDRNAGKRALFAALERNPEAAGCLPRFPANVAHGKDTTDFNDLHRLTSLTEVGRQIRHAVLRHRSGA